jgi:hypothetical protein
VYNGLVGMREISGLAGRTLVPDLAVALPLPESGRPVLHLTIRSGIRYSTGRGCWPKTSGGLARSLRGQGRPDYHTNVIGAPACIADLTQLRTCGPPYSAYAQPPSAGRHAGGPDGPDTADSGVSGGGGVKPD